MRTTLLSLAALALASVADAVLWTDAATMRAEMEKIVLAQAAHLEEQYGGVKDSEGASCSFVEACDPKKSKKAGAWASAVLTSDASFLTHASTDDPNTCLRLDKDESNRFVNPPVTGRDSSRDETQCLVGSKSGSVFQGWSPISYNAAGSNYVKNAQSKAKHFLNKGCTSAANKGNCKVNVNEYGVNLPDGTKTTSAQVHAEICITNDLEKKFQATHALYPQVSWNFLGMQKSGLFRNWPLIQQCRTESQCSGCSDPRFRGWYAGAASGPKDVVLVLDRSGSMAQENRMALAKTAAKWVINTLSWVDYATVVAFSTTTGSASSQLMQMTVENRELMKNYIDGLSAFGTTSMDLGFEKAFDILDASRAAKKSTACTTAILFMTDGIPNKGGTPAQDIVKKRNVDADARVFTYNFGNKATDTSMKAAACQGKGVYQEIKDGGNLKLAMASYFSYLAAGIIPKAPAKQTVRWAEMYEDGQGMGQNTAACAPVYDKSVTPPDLFGVVCTGISEGTLKLLTNWDAEWAKIKTSAAQCPDLFLNEEELEQIRSTIPGGVSSCKDSLMGGMGGIIGGAIGGIICVVGLIFCFMKMRGGEKAPKARAGVAVQQQQPVAKPYVQQPVGAVAVAVAQPMAANYNQAYNPNQAQGGAVAAMPMAVARAY